LITKQGKTGLVNTYGRMFYQVCIEAVHCWTQNEVPSSKEPM